MSSRINNLIIESGAFLSGVTESMVKDLGDGSYVMAKPLMFHWTLLRGDFSDHHGYFDRWCFATKELAMQALAEFPESPAGSYEPSGWHRHPMTGRRRPEGLPEAEYVDL